MIYACSSHETADDYAFVFECVKKCASYFPEISFAPTTLIADGADAIRNAWYRVYPSAQMDIMCFAHVIRNVRKRPFASKNNKKLIIDDIRKIQLAQNRKMFDEMSRLFLLKWKGVEPNFVDYFKREWLGTHSNWFEGAADYTPSTNNALESHNAVIKRKVTFRRRLPLHEFLEAMHRMASNISKQFTDRSRDIATEPDISRDTMMRAAQMANEGFKTFKGRGKESGLQFYVFQDKNIQKIMPPTNIIKIW